MNDPFKQFFIDSVKNIITQEPSAKSLFSLLKIVSPQMTMEDLMSKDTKKMLKVLKTRIHPDKHDSSDRATQLFQDVQLFYDDCINSLNKSSKRRKRPNSANDRRDGKNVFPDEFSIHKKWPATSASINTFHGHGIVISKNKNSIPNQSIYPLPADGVIEKETLAAFQAFKCIHARGAIIHQKPITKYHSWNQIEKHSKSKDSVYEIFDSFGGTRELHSIDMIKEEIMTSGPVVSVSFRLTAVYFNQLKRSSEGTTEGAFVTNILNDVHELLITGWCLTPFGEAWEIEPVLSSIDLKTSAIHIGFGQFGIDDLCLAPKSNLDHISWQPGPYFDSDFSSAPDWREWGEMDLPVTDAELKSLSKCFGTKGFMTGEPFVIRDAKKKALSASYIIHNLYYDENTNEWIVTVVREE
jgi:hypothetical protein